MSLTTVAGPPASLPSVERRREGRAVSARSLLLTVLGEFALPAAVPVWTATVVESLRLLGVEEKAARQSLARAAAEGLLVAERIGRRTRWSLSPRGAALLGEGAERIYGFLREQRTWDGNWLLLSVTVPESQRQLRHRLRTRLMWAGLGSPVPGLWVTPDSTVVDEVDTILAELGLATSSGAMSWIGTSAPIGAPQDVVRAAWELERVESAYLDFIGHFAGREPQSVVDVFVAQVELVQTWRRFVFLDPALPLELLDRHWPGPQAAATFHRCHDRWHRLAQEHWRGLTADTA